MSILYERNYDPQIYDPQDEGYYDDYPLTEQWASLLARTFISPPPL